MSRLTGAQMKYLLAVYRSQKDDNGVRSVDIAQELGVSKTSVHKMARLLTNLGFVSKKDRGRIKLTREGKNEVRVMQEKYTQIYAFFTDYLALDEAEALDSTYSFLCGFSEKCVSKLMEKLLI